MFWMPMLSVLSSGRAMCVAPCRSGAALSLPVSWQALGRGQCGRKGGRDGHDREAQPQHRTEPAPNLPLRLHHNAYVVKDHEANRRFLEDLLGIPLVATWCEKTYRADLGREVEFCHTFFGLKDGGALAFFQFADDEMYELTQAKKPPKVGSHYHIALKVSDETYDELKARLDTPPAKNSARPTTATASRSTRCRPTA